LVKKLTGQTGVKLDAFHQATGALLFSLPGLLLSWWWFDGAWPQGVSFKSASSVVYLAIMGSLVGAALFFYVLQRMSASAVSLITLMTPVLAILLGKYVAAEELSVQTLLGVGLVLLALLLYMPWSMKNGATAIAEWFEKCLGRHALPVAGNPQSALQDIKDDMIRFK
jgi:drug/metabolite transporter (DMT)-like permease